MYYIAIKEDIYGMPLEPHMHPDNHIYIFTIEEIEDFLKNTKENYVVLEYKNVIL